MVLAVASKYLSPCSVTVFQSAPTSILMSTCVSQILLAASFPMVIHTWVSIVTDGPGCSICLHLPADSTLMSTCVVRRWQVAFFQCFYYYSFVAGIWAHPTGSGTFHGFSCMDWQSSDRLCPCLVTVLPMLFLSPGSWACISHAPTHLVPGPACKFAGPVWTGPFFPCLFHLILWNQGYY